MKRARHCCSAGKREKGPVNPLTFFHQINHLDRPLLAGRLHADRVRNSCMHISDHLTRASQLSPSPKKRAPASAKISRAQAEQVPCLRRVSPLRSSPLPASLRCRNNHKCRSWSQAKGSCEHTARRNDSAMSKWHLACFLCLCFSVAPCKQVTLAYGLGRMLDQDK
jgi:hypothetical protein